MSGAPCLLADTHPAAWTFAGGGQHRTTQLYEILTAAGFEIHPVPQQAACSNLRRYALGLKYLAAAGLACGSSVRLMRRHGAVVARLAAARNERPDARVLLWEDTHRDRQALPILARRAGLTVVTVPQNLEALVQHTPGSDATDLPGTVIEEVRHLAVSNAVFCISREEQWLLAWYGVASGFLPYHPPASVLEFCSGIRERRLATNPQRWLILGSVTYRPARTGILRLIELLRDLPNGPNLAVDIVGFGSEALRPAVKGTDYQVHGGVDQDTLDSLLAEARAVLLYQPFAAGALTRVAEMLAAGVPVIANPIAARSAVHRPGVHVFESSEELAGLLQVTLPMPPSPPRSAEAERRFITEVGRLLETPVAGDRSIQR
jgi:glycosyltransferase involved in cell wall biosynthesis